MSERDGLARSVQTRLARHAREIGSDPNLVLTRYCVERFLYRLSRTTHAERFVLKGALVLLIWLGETLRPTRDADLLGFGDLSDTQLLATFREVCDVRVDVADAVSFDAASVNIAPIREADAYGGRRVTLLAKVGAARVKVQVDIGMGDVVTPAPEWLEYPSLLGFPAPKVRAYPRETVVAEKLHAIVLLGLSNSRMKDYFDLLALLREGALNETLLADAIAATFERRRTAVPDDVPEGLSDAFAADPSRRSQWHAFLSRSRIEAPQLADVVAELRGKLIPLLRRAGSDS